MPTNLGLRSGRTCMANSLHVTQPYVLPCCLQARTARCLFVCHRSLQGRGLGFGRGWLSGPASLDWRSARSRRDGPFVPLGNEESRGHTAASISWSYASRSPPFFARVMGVRSADRKTTSLGRFCRMFFAPFGIKPAMSGFATRPVLCQYVFAKVVCPGREWTDGGAEKIWGGGLDALETTKNTVKVE
jgi:hypothetical protein